MARIYSYADSADALFSPAKGLTANDYFQEWDRDDDVAEPHLLCSEMSRLAYATQEVVREALPRVGFALKGWLGGERLKERFAAWGADGFVATGGDGRTVVAFRGTESNKPEDLVVDLRTRTIAWTGDGQVHEGFADALSRIQKQLDIALFSAGSGPLLVTGHSLGAGLATLVAATLRDRQPKLITFGSPRVGDAAFARSIDAVSVARFVNCCDLVTRVPPEEFDARHIGPLLGDLTGERVLSLGLAQLIPAVLSVAGIEPSFADVGPPRYVSAAGRLADGISDDDMERDRNEARAQYRKMHHLPTLHWAALLSALRDLVKAIGGGQSVRDGLHGVGARLLPGGMGATVPLRDLADHAPINYVSAMVRSFRAEGIPDPEPQATRQTSTPPPPTPAAPVPDRQVHVPTLAFRLVVARHAVPQLLMHFETDAILEAARKVKAEVRGADDLVDVHEILERQQPGISPNPLWLAWVEATRGEGLRAAMGPGGTASPPAAPRPISRRSARGGAARPHA